MGRVVQSTKCPHCKGQTRRLCPNCHMTLPSTAGICKNLIFAVIGAKAAGKSHYIAVFIEEFRRRVGVELDVLLEPVDERTIRRYKSQFRDPVFARHEVIQATTSAVVERSVQHPLIYTLSFGGKDLFGRKRIERTVSIAFFDTAGEDLDDQDVMSTVNKYIFRADGIILLLDPLQLENVRDRLPKHTALPEVNSESADIVTRTTNLIRLGQELRPDEMISTPFAVAFSKFDAVEELVDEQFQLRAVPNHRGGFDIADFQAINDEMEALLADWHGEIIINQVRSQYHNYAFFGLSALGCNPHGTNRIPKVNPRRIEDPFLWLLYKHGLLSSNASRR